MGNVASIYIWWKYKALFQLTLIPARGSMILGVVSAVISVLIGCGLRRVANRSRTAETVINIMSVFFCIIPAWFLFKFLGEIIYFVIAGSMGRAIVCGILGWRLSYRVGKTDKSSLIGMLCLSAGRNILLDFLSGYRDLD